MNIKHVEQSINTQWQAMIKAGRIPVMEYKMSNGEWLAVDINYDMGLGYLTFSFDQDNKPCFFDGRITGQDNFYHYPIDEYSDSLDHYLQEIAGNIVEGYLMPNGLYACEDE